VTDRPHDGQSSDFWERLRQRKVVQWGLAYAAAAWGLLQGLEYLATAFDLPAVVLRLGAVAFALGLPIVLVVAWYHGERGEQGVSRTELVVVTLLLLLGGGLFWYFQRTMTAPVSPGTVRSSATAAVVRTDPSIAVLPFVNMSSDPEQAYFSDGISEELLNLLTKIPELKVIARTSSFAFKGKDADIAEIARRLDVAYVLEGSVRKSGTKLRITAQLVRTADSATLWSENYDRMLEDVFAIQDEIAASVVGQLKVRLVGAAPTVTEIDPRAYTLLLQAKAIANQGSVESMEKAIELYQQVLAIAPDEPRAWTGLADLYLGQAGDTLRPAVEARRLAGDALDRSLALDPDDAQSHALLSSIRSYGDLGRAAPNLQRALTLEPGNVEVLGSVAGFLCRLGRLDEAIALSTTITNHDPVNPRVHLALGIHLYWAHRWDDAISSMRTAMTLSPDLFAVRFNIGQALLMKGDAAAALDEMRREPDMPSRLDGVAMAAHTLGRASESDAALQEAIAGHARNQAAWIALVFAWRGEPDRAFEWLERAVTDQEPITWIALEPMFATLHRDPRWLPLLRRIGMAPEQLADIRFDVTLPK
jgi:TolB-like protein/Flp pilus assembly protein TadD